MSTGLVVYNKENYPDKYIDKAYEKTEAEINDYVHWKDIDHVYKKR